MLGTALWLPQLGKCCRKDHKHERLQGTVLHEGRWVDRTAAAATYSVEFVRAVFRLATCGYKERLGPATDCGRSAWARKR